MVVLWPVQQSLLSWVSFVLFVASLIDASSERLVPMPHSFHSVTMDLMDLMVQYGIVLTISDIYFRAQTSSLFFLNFGPDL